MNELHLAAIAAFCLFIESARNGSPACLAVVICMYYCIYILMEGANLGEVKDAWWLDFYVRQSALDLLFILICCVLSTFYQYLKWPAIWYSAIIATSQLVQLLMIVNHTQFSGLYDMRQSVAVYVDLLFAALGSNCVVRIYILRFADFAVDAYNRHILNNSGGIK